MIDRRTLSIKIAVERKEGTFTIIIPDPIEERVTPITTVLANMVNDLVAFNNIPLYLPILQADIKDRIKLACERIPISSNRPSTHYISAMDTFLDFIFSTASVITPSLEIVPFPEIEKDFTETNKDYIRGSYIFFYLMLRYNGEAISEEESDFYTSSKITELVARMKAEIKG